MTIKRMILLSFSAVLPEVCRELQYVHKITGKALEGHVIKTIQVQHNDQCELSCFVELECNSYNLGPLQVNGHTCELSKSDHLRHPDDFVTKPSYIYSGTKVRSWLFNVVWLVQFL